MPQKENKTRGHRKKKNKNRILKRDKRKRGREMKEARDKLTEKNMNKK